MPTESWLILLQHCRDAGGRPSRILSCLHRPRFFHVSLPQSTRREGQKPFSSALSARDLVSGRIQVFVWFVTKTWRARASSRPTSKSPSVYCSLPVGAWLCFGFACSIVLQPVFAVMCLIAFTSKQVSAPHLSKKLVSGCLSSFSDLVFGIAKACSNRLMSIQ